MKFVFALLLSSTAYAAGDGHSDAGPASLISAAVNLSILVGFLIWKLKGPAKEMFVNKSVETKDMIDSAASKAKEAKIMMETHQKKLDGVESEISKLEADAKAQVERFEKEYQSETENRVNKLKEDAGHKIEAEKKELLDSLNSQLLDQVISNARNKLQADKALGNDASKRILQGLN